MLKHTNEVSQYGRNTMTGNEPLLQVYGDQPCHHTCKDREVEEVLPNRQLRKTPDIRGAEVK